MFLVVELCVLNGTFKNILVILWSEVIYKRRNKPEYKDMIAILLNETDKPYQLFMTG